LESVFALIVRPLGPALEAFMDSKLTFVFFLAIAQAPLEFQTAPSVGPLALAPLGYFTPVGGTGRLVSGPVSASVLPMVPQG
jgi:hypothetical protein